MEKFKVYLYSGIAVVVIVVVIYLWGKSVGAKVNTTTLPNDTAWGKTLTQAESAQVAALADSLYNDMKGVNAWPFAQHENKPYEDLSGLSDTLLVAVSNQFSTRYGDTLVSWLEAEYFSASSIELAGVVSIVVARLKKLTNNK
jgi:hypothetical protein